ncbi:PAS domain S-box protein [Ciceribacter sp. L1K23]|uniref:ATP-binding protein n=1 Tax=unclassified Ciceribacter TaxID=2628820 RepID=UPI001ABE1CCF|nr:MULTISPECIES: ATP-binding protein [unclassified Ciceribacter]MBO3758927.1 PAS domain S-box protein [Ciceribacter sp. L1K22]MBR0556927.1 PAS domain S-box protein [Ciceribacter sp. L1K23]
MPAAQYPFIDVAVHNAVRARFARGEALVLFSADMQTVLWANGPGAAHFGNASIYDFLDQGPDRSELSFRQLAASAGQLSAIGDSRTLVIRIASGFRSVPVQAEVELIDIRGERAVLFCLPAAGQSTSTEALAKRMLTGFDDPDTHMAVLDSSGEIVAASPGFAGLGIGAASARGFITMVENEPAHLLKRPLSTVRGHLPAAIGKVSDSPDLYLLLAVETILGDFRPADASPTADVASAPAEPVAALPLPEAATISSEEAPADSINASAEPSASFPADEEPAAASPSDMEEEEAAPAMETPASPEPVSETPQATAAESAEPVAAPADEPVAPLANHTAPAAPSTEEDGFVFQPTNRATRFVWKIDAEGRFTDVSREFAAAVGPRAAAIEGVAFTDIDALFHLDPDGKLGELLNRRDTWSGKTVYWPVEGTSLRVPVDLAALPTYTRNREFDGFRGFGVVRLADAVEDPLESGLTLGSQSMSSDVPAEEQEPSVSDETPDAEASEVLPDILSEADAMTAQARRASEIDPGHAGEAEAQDETAKTGDGGASVQTEAATVIPLISDKIIQLENHRARNRDGLSASEAAAFREIARKLDPIRPSQDNPEPTHETVQETPVATTTIPPAPTPPTPVSPAIRSPEPPVFRPVPDAAAFTPQQRDLGLSADIVDLMPVALLVHVADRLIHGNPEFLKLTGYADLDALASAGGLDALLQREDLDEAEGKGSRIVVVRADDRLVPVNAKLQSIRWAGGSALMLSLVPVEAPETVVAPAIVEEETSELSRLRVEAEEMRSILETATDGVVIIGTEGEIRSMNRSASALFNYDGEELKGKPFVMLFAHESQRAILDYLSGLAGHGVASVLNDGREVIGREASGGFLPLFMTIGRLTSSNGYCAVIRDITQWKRTEEELRGAKRAAETANAHKSEFLARVSHEIRTPLNAIIGFADIMANEHFGPVGHPRYAEYASDIVRSGRHVLDIVNDLLDISKIEAGEMDLDFTAVGLNETVSQAVAIVQPQANGQRVIIRTALSQAVPSVVADLRSIKQIVLNILANAIRFTPSGGQIIVSTAYEANGSVVLRIRDTGIGMSRTELEQAMKPFRQVSPGARNRGDGTGLGLPLTKAMVDANRATFAISSTPNEGTLVEITFPSPRVLAD